VAGIQISKTISELLNRQEIKALNCSFEDADIENKEFDAVVVFHVLGHVKDPAKAIDKYNDILKEGGILIDEVPNIDSWSCCYGREKWNAYDVPNHIVNFNKDLLTKLMIQKGFFPLETSTWNFEIVPVIFLQTFMNRFLKSNYYYLTLQTMRVRRYVVLFVYLLLIPVFVVVERIAILVNKGNVIRHVLRKNRT
jgi:SAM-dependent methyltransferase